MCSLTPATSGPAHQKVPLNDGIFREQLDNKNGCFSNVLFRLIANFEEPLRQ